jgi:hypothetical protein
VSDQARAQTVHEADLQRRTYQQVGADPARRPAMWPGAANGPRRDHWTSERPTSALDAVLRGDDTVRVLRPPAPRYNPRFDVECFRSEGELDDAARTRALIGPEHWTDARPEDPGQAEDPRELHPMRHMTRAVGLKTAHGLRQWIAAGIMPDAEVRGPGDHRYFTAAQVNGARMIAAEEGLHDKPRRNVSTTDFQARVHDLFQELKITRSAEELPK